MRRDPVAELGGRPAPRPVWKSFMFWLMLLVICVSLAGLGIGNAARLRSQHADRHAIEALKEQAAIAKQQAVLAKAQAADAKALETEVQRGVCRTFLFIASIPLTATATTNLRTIVGSTHDGAVALHCPSVMP